MQLTCTQASTKDADFIISLIMAGARKGHYYSLFVDNKQLLRKMVNSIIIDGVQYDSRHLASEALVGRFGNTRIGAVITTQTEKKDNSIELAAITVKKQFQDMGFGRGMLDIILARWLPEKTIYARCFPDSEKLAQMLLRRGFSLISITESGTRILKHLRETSPEHNAGPPIRLFSTG